MKRDARYAFLQITVVWVLARPLAEVGSFFSFISGLFPRLTATEEGMWLVGGYYGDQELR